MYYFTHHTLPTFHHRISIYSDRHNTVYVTKNSKIYTISKMVYPDILLKN